MAHNAAHDHHFNMKQLAEKFKSQFEFIGENDGKWYYFLVPIKKERDNGKTATYKLKFIDSFRYMPTSLSNIVDNLSEIYKKNSKHCMPWRKACKKKKYLIRMWFYWS